MLMLKIHARYNLLSTFIFILHVIYIYVIYVYVLHLSHLHLCHLSLKIKNIYFHELS
jgi:hypothetical protein